MGNKDNIVILLFRQVSILEILPITVGVPAMITVIVAIWGSLDPDQRIVVTVGAFLVVLTLVLFIYGRIRRVLLVIPYLLKKKHRLAETIAINIVAPWDANNIGDVLKLAGVNIGDINHLFDRLVKAREILETSGVIEMALEQSKEKAQKEIDTELIISEFLAEQSGFTKALENNPEYKKLEMKLNEWKDKVPTEEISSAISEYERNSYLSNSLIPLRENQFVSDNLPLEYKLQSIVNSKKVGDAMRSQLAKVRQSIINYYKG